MSENKSMILKPSFWVKILPTNFFNQTIGVISPPGVHSNYTSTERLWFWNSVKMVIKPWQHSWLKLKAGVTDWESNPKQVGRVLILVSVTTTWLNEAKVVATCFSSRPTHQKSIWRYSPTWFFMWQHNYWCAWRSYVDFSTCIFDINGSVETIVLYQHGKVRRLRWTSILIDSTEKHRYKHLMTFFCMFYIWKL